MNTAKLKAVPRHSVDGYGRQDICYNDPEGEFVFYSDYEALIAALEAAQKRNAELEARTVTLPRPACTYADHSYPAYSEKQVVELLESLGINLETGGEA